MSLIKLEQVTKRFGALTVLDSVSLSVNAGDIVAVIGRSGSGKSTMLRCINALEPIQGGKIKVGSHVLEIPAGALAGYVTIVAEQITGSTNSVRFSPEGLTFDRPALLTLSYDNCLAPPVARKIVYTTDRLEILELLKSVDKVQTKTVISPIDHFSRYAVAY